MSLSKAKRAAVLVRECEPRDEPEACRIFTEGITEMITDSAFRGLPHHPDRLLLYGVFTVISSWKTSCKWYLASCTHGCVSPASQRCCELVKLHRNAPASPPDAPGEGLAPPSIPSWIQTLSVSALWLSSCWWALVFVPLAILTARFWVSHRVVHCLIEHYLRTDMADIQRNYIKTPGSCFWVAEVDGSVVGLAAAVQTSRHTVELQRMSVDHRYRGCGIAMALGRRFVEFARSGGFSKATLGTVSNRPPAHRLYRRLGFHRVSVSNGYWPNSEPDSLLMRLFYYISYHNYEMELQPEDHTEDREQF